MKQNRALIKIAVIGVAFAGLTLASWFMPSKDFSLSERRKLAQFPEVSMNSVSDGSFMKSFEKYTQDQFPLRERFRTAKAFTSYFAFGQLDNHEIYIEDGYAARLEYPLNKDSLTYAAGRFEYIYKTYLEDKDVNTFLSIVPDKSYYLAKKSGHLCMDYEEIFRVMKEKMGYAAYIDITKTLDIKDYYKTDPHWRQEKIMEAADTLADGMGIELSCSYEKHKLDVPFYGVYCGQSALSLSPDSISYLTNDTIESCIVTDYESGKTGAVYDMKKVHGKDPYEMFLSGPRSLITIENPNCEPDKELVIFRDSFASSIAPLLAEGYSKITLVDIRYLRSDFVGKYIEFDDQDVLFMYSTSVLNNSSTLI